MSGRTPASSNTADKVWDTIARGTGIRNCSTENIASLLPAAVSFERHVSDAIRFRELLDNRCTNRQVCAVCSQYCSIMDMYNPFANVVEPVVVADPANEPAISGDAVNDVEVRSEASVDDDGDEARSAASSFINDVASSASSVSRLVDAASDMSIDDHFADDYADCIDADDDCGHPAYHHIDLLKQIRVPISTIPNLDLLLADVQSTLEHPRHALTTYSLDVHVPPNASIQKLYCIQPFSIHSSDNPFDPTAVICNDCYKHLSRGRVPPDSLVCYDTGQSVSFPTIKCGNAKCHVFIKMLMLNEYPTTMCNRVSSNRSRNQRALGAFDDYRGEPRFSISVPSSALVDETSCLVLGSGRDSSVVPSRSCHRNAEYWT